MGKYEKKITKSKHINKLIIAVLLSMMLGIGAGYFLGLRSSKQKQVEKPVVVQKEIVKPKVVETVQNNTPSDSEQTILIKDALNAFYNVNLNTFKRLKDESLEESNTTGALQDSIFKGKLIKEYQVVFANKQLEAITNFINNGNLQFGYFLDFFNSQEGSTINSVENVEFKDNSISAKVVVVNPFEYGSLYDIPTVDSFFGEFKGSGLTNKQYTKLLKLRPSKVNMIETKVVTLEIENINGKWLITEFNDELDSSVIRDATIRGKTVAYADLMRRYIK